MTHHPHMHLTEVAAVTLKFKAYNATGELDLRRDSFILGTRVLLTCDVTGLSEEALKGGVRYEMETLTTE